MRSRSLLALALIASTALSVWAQPTIRTFADRDWSIELPAGYSHAKEAKPTPESMTIAFFPDARPDKTRPIVQVTMYNAGDGGRSPKFEPAFAQSAIDGVKKNRSDWKLKTSTVQLGELTVTRYEWSGVAKAKVAGATVNVPSRGIMLVGADKGVGFSLHVQDVSEHANKTLAAGEKALRSFRFAD
jgi:hypothetical protein